jgi:DNA-binding MarR family transcriptional regulator
METVATLAKRISMLEEMLGNVTHSSINRNIDDLLLIELKIRQIRNSLFPAQYFADAAWEILLDLEQARREHRKLSLSDIGLGAQIPPTTVLRYVDRLVADGVVQRQPDPHDRRRVFISLTAEGASKMNRIFSDNVAVTDNGDGVGNERRAAHNDGGFREFPGRSVFAA